MIPALSNDPFTILLADFKRQAAELIYKFIGINVTSASPIRVMGFSYPANKAFDTVWELGVNHLRQNPNVQGFMQAIQQDPKLADAGADMLKDKFKDSVDTWKEKLQSYSKPVEKIESNLNIGEDCNGNELLLPGTSDSAGSDNN